MHSLCTLRNRSRQRSRNTRYHAGAAPYVGRTSTGWIAPACLAHSLDQPQAPPFQDAGLFFGPLSTPLGGFQKQREPRVHAGRRPTKAALASTSKSSSFHSRDERETEARLTISCLGLVFRDSGLQCGCSCNHAIQQSSGRAGVIAPLQSITSSARPSNVSGTVKPSAFAVLRLITNSNFVG
jgi:hypothetical protein